MEANLSKDNKTNVVQFPVFPTRSYESVVLPTKDELAGAVEISLPDLGGNTSNIQSEAFLMRIKLNTLKGKPPDSKIQEMRDLCDGYDDDQVLNLLRSADITEVSRRPAFYTALADRAMKRR